MKILLTNDDGIDADGIHHLEEVASNFGDIVVVAPKQHLSGCSHQMTFDGHIESGQKDENHYWVDGFPSDCVRIALARICPDADLVLSGINHGSNLGLDNFLSGTVAAAREGTFFGLPSIAFSQYHRGIDEHVWKAARIMTQRMLEQLLPEKLVPGSYWNVNFPIADGLDVQNIPFVERPLDLCPLPNDYTPDETGYYYAGDYHSREYSEGTDVAACQDGNIVTTLVKTGSDAMVELRKKMRAGLA